MMRSMYSGVTGLQNHQTRMDVIGNNIANVNTVGFKKSRVIFQDALYQKLNGGSAPVDGGRGGTNPQSIGLGVTIASIDTIHTSGSPQSTGKPTDLAIDGNGYFILSPTPDSSGQLYFTRAGNFDFDEYENYLTPGNGMHVMGWVADPTQVDANGRWELDTTSQPTSIDISALQTVAPRATTYINFGGNFNAEADPLRVFGLYDDDGNPATPDVLGLVAGPRTPVPTPIQYKVYDALGNEHTLYMTLTKIVASDELIDTGTGTAAQIIDGTGLGSYAPGTCWRLRIDASHDGSNLNSYPTNAANNTVADYYIVFDQEGRMVDIAAWTPPGGPGTINDNNIQWANIYDNAFAGHTRDLDANLVLNLTANDPQYAGTATPQTINLRFADESNVPLVTQFKGDASVKVKNQDGYTRGSLESISFDQTGTLVGAYSNGISQNMARVAIATFANPAGLTPKGGNMYQISPNSGEAQIYPPGAEGAGVIKPSYLEMSNVDLSEEFTNMIVTQRGFQANSRVITTTDEMLQELVNLKRS